MSEEWTPYTPGSDDDPLDPLQEALLQFTGCVGEAFTDICSYGLTVGDSYVPFDPDPEDGCEDEEAACSQVWVRVTDVTPDASDGWEGDCGVVLRIGLEVGIVRCFTIPDGGEAPTATDVMLAALQSARDMKTMFCAAMGCEVWNSIEAGQWTPQGPLGGQYGGTWEFTVEL